MYVFGYVVTVMTIAVHRFGVDVGIEIFRSFHPYVAGRGSLDCIGMKITEYLCEYFPVSMHIGGLHVGVSKSFSEKRKVG